MTQQLVSGKMSLITELGRTKGFDVEEGKDYGAGEVDVIWRIPVHHGLPEIKCGFITLQDAEGGVPDTADNQFSLRKIEEGIIRGLRSGMDKVYLVTENEDMMKSVSGKIEWLASHGSFLRLDAISLALFPQQQVSSVVTPSQRRVPKGAKIRKQVMRKREAKLNKHNRPKHREKSSTRREMREAKIDRFSRPKNQTPKRRKRHNI